MRRHGIIATIVALCFLAGVLLGYPPWRRWQESVQIKRELGWIQKAARQLQQVGPPPVELTTNAASGRWVTDGWLLFTNGWAAYSMHSWHDNDGMDDIALLRTSEGRWYLSKCHLCGGIASELMRPDRELEGSAGQAARPADASDFIERWGKRQQWTVFSPDGRLRCAVRSPQAGHGKEAKKGLWVWIGNAEGTNETTLFERRYIVSGSYLSWTTRWITTNELALDVYDYGPGLPPFMHENQPRRYITNFTFRRDSQTTQFAEGKPNAR